jgi:cystatin-C
MKKLLISFCMLMGLMACGGELQQKNPVTASLSNPPVLGGYQYVSPRDPDALKAANFVVTHFNARAGFSPHFYRLSELLSAQTQVVAGVNYLLELELSHGSEREVHQVVVFSQPWLNKMELKEHQLISSLPGGYYPVSVKNPQVMGAAEFAVGEINKRSNSLTPYVGEEIFAASSQVVAGMNYRLVLRLKRGEILETHEAVVYFIPWLNSMELTEHKILD